MLRTIVLTTVGREHDLALARGYVVGTELSLHSHTVFTAELTTKPFVQMRTIGIAHPTHHLRKRGTSHWIKGSNTTMTMPYRGTGKYQLTTEVCVICVYVENEVPKGGTDIKGYHRYCEAQTPKGVVVRSTKYAI